MANLGKLQVAIGADTSEFDRGMNQAQSRMGQFADRARAVVRAGAAIGAAATAAGIAIATRFTAAQFRAIDAQAKLAQSLQTTTASMATLERAGELAGVSMQGIEQFTKDLTRRLSQAAEGGGPAADALDRLGLSAQQLMQMPLDQRVATINRAIRDFVPAAEQAAVAGKLFGEEGSIAASRLSPETIQEAAKQAEAFGLAVSDVDASAIERANDAMSTISAVLQGVFRRIAVQVAPAVEHLANLFKDTAMETRGWEDQVGRTMTFAGRAVGLVGDGINGLVVGFKASQVAGNAFRVAMLTIADAVAGSFNSVIQGIIDRVRGVVQFINSMPGPDIPLGNLEAISEGFDASREQMALWSEQARQDLAGSIENFHTAAMRPVPSDMIAQFFEDAKEASRLASEQIVADRAAMLGTGEAGFEEIEKIKEINGVKEEEEKRHRESMKNIAMTGAKAAADETIKQGQREIQTRQQQMQALQSGVSNILGAMAQENKAFGIAQAVINTWRGVSESLAAYPWPISGVMAAASLAAGLQTVRGIQSSATKGGGGASAGAISGGGAGAAASSQQAQSQGGGGQQGGRTATVNLAGDVFSREGVMGLMDQMNELMADGYTGVTMA